MATNLARDAAGCQSESLDHGDRARATSVAQVAEHVDMLLTFVRQSMHESGFNAEALAAAMGYKDASYPGKVLKGEKPLSLTFIVMLPRDVRTKFVDKWAEHHDLICVAPLSGHAAREALVAGFFGVTAPQQEMPAKAGPALKVNLDRRGKAAAR